MKGRLKVRFVLTKLLHECGWVRTTVEGGLSSDSAQSRPERNHPRSCPSEYGPRDPSGPRPTDHVVIRRNQTVVVLGRVSDDPVRDYFMTPYFRGSVFTSQSLRLCIVQPDHCSFSDGSSTAGSATGVRTQPLLGPGTADGDVHGEEREGDSPEPRGGGDARRGHGSGLREAGPGTGRTCVVVG